MKLTEALEEAIDSGEERFPGGFYILKLDELQRWVG